jgi:hypothetical protein
MAASLTFFPAVGADAEERRSTDASGDVVAVQVDAGPNLEHEATRLPERRHGDIVTLRAAHAPRSVVAGLRFRNIRSDERMSHDLVVRTPVARFSFSFANTGRRVFDRFFLNETTGKAIRCPGFGVDVAPAEHRLRLMVPRGCVGHPHWVRVGAETTTRNVNGHFHYDDALRRGEDDPDWHFSGPVLGPRLQRS